MPKRGRPFEPGNKFGRGRPRGSRNKSGMAANRLLAQYSDPLLRKAITMALQGDGSTMRLLLSLILPRCHELPVKTGPLPMDTLGDLAQSFGVMIAGVAAGKLTPSQALEISRLMETRRKIIETQDLEPLVQAIEDRIREQEK